MSQLSGEDFYGSKDQPCRTPFTSPYFLQALMSRGQTVTEGP